MLILEMLTNQLNNSNQIKLTKKEEWKEDDR